MHRRTLAEHAPRGRGFWALALLLLACTDPAPAPPPRDGGQADGPVCGDGGGADLCPARPDLPDPIVGRACGPGNFCPCGYFCPQGVCEVADFHPPCDMSR